MYEIQFSTAMSVLLNETKSSTSGAKVDCAKECPCGVPVIPVPDQWLEVMVTGGFKVWHIIFIIIAFVVTLVVVYCCFHRCRIPRTKQEIEADLMRTNLTGKFRDYLQEFPNEPTTFLDALKRVQELEEKAQDNDDSVAKKRMGWLKLKGKDRAEKEAAGGQDQANTKPDVANDNQEAVDTAAQGPASEQDRAALKEARAPEGEPSRRTEKQSMFAARLKEQAKLQANSSLADEDQQQQQQQQRQNQLIKSDLPLAKTKSATKASDSKPSTAKEAAKAEHNSNLLSAPSKEARTKRKAKDASEGTIADKSAAKPENGINYSATQRQDLAGDESINDSSVTKLTKSRRRRGDKPGLKRTKATHAKLNSGESGERLELVPPEVQMRETAHNRKQTPTCPASSQKLELPPNTAISHTSKNNQTRTVRLIKSEASKGKPKGSAGKTSTPSSTSTVIHIPGEH